jgi:hypothetical protein
MDESGRRGGALGAGLAGTGEELSGRPTADGPDSNSVDEVCVGGFDVKCRHQALAILIGSSWSAAACLPPPALVVQVNDYPGYDPSRVIRSCDGADPRNELEILEAERPMPDGCRQRGDIFIGDSGSTSKCKPKHLLDELRSAACARGIEKAQIIHITPPRGGSSCHQLRAALLTCDSRADTPAEGSEQ